MKTMKIILGVGLIMALAGCSSRFVKSDFDREVNFDQFKTYSWMVQPEASGRNPFAQNTLLGKRIRNAVEMELAAQGFQKQASGNPDFVIAYHVILEDKVDLTSHGYGYGYGYGYRGRYYRYPYWGGYYDSNAFNVRQYTEGTLILDFIDPGADQMVWRGWYSDAVGEGEISEKKINTAVKHILEKFPPQTIAGNSETTKAVG